MATTKRTYGDRCGVARALDIVGERWALLVVRELLLGPKRFTDLRAGLPHVGPDILAQRLRELEAVRRRAAPHAAAARRLADLRAHRARAQLEPVVLALGRFGSVAPFPPGEAQIGVDAVRHRPQDALRPGRRRRPERELRAAPRRAALPPARGRRPARRSRAGAPSARRRSSRPTPATLATVLWHGRDARRGAPRRRPRRQRRPGGRHAPPRAVPAPLLTLQSCGRARRRAGQSA